MRSGASGLNLIDSVYERLLAERIIFLGTQVDDDIANRLCAQILLLSAEDPTKDINLYINSPGGSITRRHGDLRHDGPRAMRRRHLRDGPGRIDGRVPARRRHQGQALRAAARAHHDAPALRWYRWQRGGHRHPGRAVRTDKKEMYRLNAEFTGQTLERIETDADRDRWFTAPEALEYGFVDHIITHANFNGSAS